MRAALVVLALLVPASVADAHTLSLRGAERVATRYAERVAAAVMPRPDRTTVHACLRRTPHAVECLATFRFGAVACERVIRVRFTSTEHRRVSRRFVGELYCL